MKPTETIAVADKDGNVTEQRLERIALLVQNALDRELVEKMPDVSFTAMVEANAGFMVNTIAVRLRGRVLGRRGAYEVIDVGPPTAWWHLYAKLAPRWLRRRIEPRRCYRILRPLVLYPNIREGIPALDWEDFGTYVWPRDREVIEAYRKGRQA